MFLLLSLLAYASYNIAPTYSSQAVEDSFELTKQRFEQRWETFSETPTLIPFYSNTRTFVPFQPGRSNAELEAEFTELNDTRHKLWFRDPNSSIYESNPDYTVFTDYIFHDLARCKNCMAFIYNGYYYYNASFIHLGHRGSIACEGPRSKDIPAFFSMLSQLHVTDLVRLTASYEGETKKCHPYWEGLVTGETLHIPLGDNISYPMHYFVEETWRDNSGIDPKQLLALVRKVKQSLDAKQGRLAVHCSAGVGRTGTFLAALGILDAIENNQPFSIQEIVYRLSLQRIHSVGKAAQYVTLHRFAEEALR